MTGLNYTKQKTVIGSWKGPESSVQIDPDQIRAQILDLSQNVFLLDVQGQIATSADGILTKGNFNESGLPVVGDLPTVAPSQFGDPAFLQAYGIKAAYMAGSMANAISGVNLVTALGQAGYLASYGAGGVSPARLLDAIQSIKSALPDGPYAFNLIHNPHEPLLEQTAVDLYLEHQVRVIEASAFLRLTPSVVQFRAAGLAETPSGEVQIHNKVIAKLSRPEVAVQFLNPAPERILQQLVSEGKITKRQAELAGMVPMADDITVGFRRPYR
ncbi:MAG: hypothetical protein P8Y34_08305 [Anaerolineales bacterium]